MGSFEKDQEHLGKPMDEILSDEEVDPFEASSDSLSSYGSEDRDEPLIKRKKQEIIQ